ncbi:multidrug and toxin extrusion protein 1-like [Lineus longissimus]|uniref:multidrug and toxin extrusion protein 1-like n=1 Tax=Lineus longissimus TaxID=88925 RepID=UPI002B4C941E
MAMVRPPNRHPSDSEAAMEDVSFEQQEHGESGGHLRIEGTEEEDKPSCLCKYLPKWFGEEFRETFRMAWPMILIAVFQYLLMPITLLFCGHLNTTDLGAVALANTIINVMGIGVGNGLTTACDTLFSQTYGGANLKQYGVWLQRSLLIMSLACIPCWCIHLNTETLLVLLGQNREQAAIAGRYMVIFVPGLLANFIYQTLAKYLQNQNIVLPLIIVGICGNLMNALMHYILLFVVEMGTDGSAIAQVLGHSTFTIGTILYILVSKKYEETWGGWTLDAFKQWGIFIRYALPGMFMLMLDFMCFEIGTFTAGLLSQEDLAAQAVILQLGTMAYQIPCGAGYTCSIRVGQHLGANNPTAAKRSALVAMAVACMVAVITVILFTSTSTVLPLAFSEDPAVVAIASQLMPILAVFEFCDAISAVSGGALRGCGKQVIGALGIFGGFYGVGIPIAMVLMFLTDLRTAGFWWGMCIGVTAAATILFLAAIVCNNWPREARLAMRRAGIKRKRRESQYRSNSVSGFENDLLADETTDLLEHKKSRSPSIYSWGSTYSVGSDIDEETQTQGNKYIFNRIIAILVLLVLLSVAAYLHIELVMPWPASAICFSRNNTNMTIFSNHSTILVNNITYPIC